MQFVATQKITRQSPRKVRLVANQVKALPLSDMLQQLAVIERRATLVLLKTLKQAIANATNNHGVAFDDLELAELLVNEGPRYKRFRAVSRGQAHSIIKRTCHVRVVLRTKAKTKSQVEDAQDSRKSVDKEVKNQVKVTDTKESKKSDAVEPKKKAEKAEKKVKTVQTSAKPKTASKKSAQAKVTSKNK